ncbi:hypothetical protein FPV67DRAFT_1496862 [Lyophyllum atratum]|nr:hypothetical protein FPV67DRAFT_1496862 [Lyophyllum atratum]
MPGLMLKRETSLDGYRTFASVPRNNHYLPILHSPASHSLSRYPGSLSPVSPHFGRRPSCSPKKTPSPPRKTRSSTSASTAGKFMNKLKSGAKVLRLLPKSPVRPGAGGALHKKRSFAGVGWWEEHSPQRLHNLRIAELRRLRDARPAMIANGEREWDDGEDRWNGDEDMLVQVLEFGPQATDPFATPPVTPTHVVPLSPTGLNMIVPRDADSDSLRSRKTRAVERKSTKLERTLGPESIDAVAEHCRKYVVVV